MYKTREMMEGTHKRWTEDHWELELEDTTPDGECPVCGLVGGHKMSCPLRYTNNQPSPA